MYGHVITKFSGMVDYHISLAMGLRARVELRYERVGKSVVSVAKKAEKCQQMNFMAEKKSWFCDLFIF